MRRRVVEGWMWSNWGGERAGGDGMFVGFVEIGLDENVKRIFGLK